MDLQLRVLVEGQDGKRSVARTSTNFKNRYGAGIFLSDLVQYRKFLLQPLAVLEEIGSVVLVKEVPPLGRIRIEPVCIIDGQQQRS